MEILHKVCIEMELKNYFGIKNNFKTCEFSKGCFNELFEDTSYIWIVTCNERKLSFLFHCP